MPRTQLRNRSGVIAGRARPRYMSYHHGLVAKTVDKRREKLHQNDQTNAYLRCLMDGAAMVDPGDLDTTTRLELERLTQEGVLTCQQDHGRRLWRKM